MIARLSLSRICAPVLHVRSVVRPILLLLFVGLFVVLSAPLRAQNANAALRGQVQDSTGARVTGARVVLRSAASSVSRTVTTDDRGEFRIDGLLPGSYQVRVMAKSFAEATADVAVAVSNVEDVTVTLHPGSSRETVNVSSPSSITQATVNAASAVRGGVVGTQDLEGLPLPARSFANIAYLVPGTEPVEPSDPTKARITAVSTGGSSGLNNELSVDGADNSDDWIGGFLQKATTP